jgi:hypothetical protein
MNYTLSTFFAVAAVAGLALNAPTAEASSKRSSATAVVDFSNHEDFTDVAINGRHDTRGRETVFKELEQHLNNLARRYLEDGERLEIVFHDIDMAGDFEEWRGPRFADVRIVRDIYPPRLKFGWQVIGAEGAVLGEGVEDLTDLAFNWSINPIDRDYSRYEKELLSSWARRNLR